MVATITATGGLVAVGWAGDEEQAASFGMVGRGCGPTLLSVTAAGLEEASRTGAGSILCFDGIPLTNYRKRGNDRMGHVGSLAFIVSCVTRHVGDDVGNAPSRLVIGVTKLQKKIYGKKRQGVFQALRRLSLSTQFRPTRRELRRDRSALLPAVAVDLSQPAAYRPEYPAEDPRRLESPPCADRPRCRTTLATVT